MPRIGSKNGKVQYSRPSGLRVQAQKEHRRSLAKYGLTPGQYAALLQRQNGVCAICGVAPKKIRLHVDHDHADGRIRGLLCHMCNYRLVLHRHTPVILRRAAEYLEDSFDGRTIAPIPTDSVPDVIMDCKGEQVRLRVLRLSIGGIERLEKYLDEPGIDACVVTYVPPVNKPGGKESTFVAMTEYQWMRINGPQRMLPGIPKPSLK